MIANDWVIRILEHFKKGRQSRVEDDVVDMLKADRKIGLDALNELLQRLNGPRLKVILEAAMDDGGEDLIPLFIHALQREQNVLFQKSILFLYRNFEFYEARTALAEAATRLPASLKVETDRVLADFSARFRHLFYLEQWQQAKGDVRHVKHAGDAMLRHPHPAFRPVLHEELRSENSQESTIALQILHHQGDKETLEVLFGLLPGSFFQLESLQRLVHFLCRNRGKRALKLSAFMSELGRLLGWTSNAVKEAERNLNKVGADTFAHKILEELGLKGHQMEDVLKRVLVDAVSGRPLDDIRVNSLRRQHRQCQETHMTTLKNYFAAIGCIGRRHKVEGLLLKVQAFIPDDETNGGNQTFVIAFLDQYRSGEGLSFLLNCLAEDLPKNIRQSALEALRHHQVMPIPEVVRAIAERGDGTLKLKAEGLISQWEKTALRDIKAATSAGPKPVEETDIWIKGLSSDLRKVWTSTLRRLNLCYKDGLVKDKKALSQCLIALFQQNTMTGELLKIGLSLAGKIATPELVECLHEYQTNGDPTLAGFASNVLAHEHLDDKAGPIRSIFIIDDARMVVRSLTRQLEGSGLKIGCSSDTVDGLRALAMDHYDALLVDYHMPIMNGVQFLYQARKQAIAPPKIIVMTTSREDDVINDIRAHGVHDILHKPFRPDMLLQLLGVAAKKQAS